MKKKIDAVELQDKGLFSMDEFQCYFTDEQRKQLEKIQPNARYDTQFVKQILIFMYAENENIPTLRGPTKMDEEIKILIKSMLQRRIAHFATTQELNKRANDGRISHILSDCLYRLRKKESDHGDENENTGNALYE
jgi:hypothetical protein